MRRTTKTAKKEGVGVGRSEKLAVESRRARGGWRERGRARAHARQRGRRPSHLEDASLLRRELLESVQHRRGRRSHLLSFVLVFRVGLQTPSEISQISQIETNENISSNLRFFFLAKK